MQTKNVVITGLGALTPIGNNVQSYWKSLTQGLSGSAPITRFDASRYKTRFACELKDFDSTDYFDSKELKRLGPCSQYALVACQEAIQDASLDLVHIAPERIGAVWATGTGGLGDVADYMIKFLQEQNPSISPLFIPKLLVDMPAGHISMKYGLQGPNHAALAACASANNAIIDAAQLIQLGHADVMIAGGSEAPITGIGISGFSALRVLSERNEDPQTASRPFDKHRDGFVMGEGAGALILESYEHAQARGATIYGTLIGVGMSADAHHITTPHPEGRGAVLAMTNALQNAHIQPEDVDYINVHGTSTVLGDLSEGKAIQQVFAKAARCLNISATKSMTGHLLGASGAIEAIASILTLHHQMVPPTINHFTADEAFDPQFNFTFNQAQSRAVNIAISNSFGFGGRNTCVVFKKQES